MVPFSIPYNAFLGFSSIKVKKIFKIGDSINTDFFFSLVNEFMNQQESSKLMTEMNLGSYFWILLLILEFHDHRLKK